MKRKALAEICTVAEWMEAFKKAGFFVMSYPSEPLYSSTTVANPHTYRFSKNLVFYQGVACASATLPGMFVKNVTPYYESENVSKIE